MYKRHLFRLGVGAVAEVKMSEQGWRDFLTAQNDSDWAVPPERRREEQHERLRVIGDEDARRRAIESEARLDDEGAVDAERQR